MQIWFFKSLAQSASVNFPTSLCPFVQPVALDATTRAKRLLSFLDTCPVKLAPQCKLCAFFRAWSASLIPFVTLHMLFIPSRMPPTCLVVLQDSAQGHFFRGFPTSLSSLPPRTCACQLNTFPVYWIPWGWGPALFSFLSQVPTIVLSTWWFLRKHFREWIGLSKHINWHESAPFSAN